MWWAYSPHHLLLLQLLPCFLPNNHKKVLSRSARTRSRGRYTTSHRDHTQATFLLWYHVLLCCFNLHSSEIPIQIRIYGFNCFVHYGESSSPTIFHVQNLPFLLTRFSCFSLLFLCLFSFTSHSHHGFNMQLRETPFSSQSKKTVMHENYKKWIHLIVKYFHKSQNFHFLFHVMLLF